MNTTFLLQGLHMRISLFNDTNDSTKDLSVVPPAWLSLVDVVFVLILIPILDKRFYPWLDKKGWSLSVFTRISIGKFSDHLISISVILTLPLPHLFPFLVDLFKEKYHNCTVIIPLRKCCSLKLSKVIASLRMFSDHKKWSITDNFCVKISWLIGTQNKTAPEGYHSIALCTHSIPAMLGRCCQCDFGPSYFN